MTTAAPIDHEHLSRYTFGDRALEEEVLSLFAMQLPVTLDLLKAADTPNEWNRAAHTLKGSARAVGAFKLASAAEAAERDQSKPSLYPVHLQIISQEIARAISYVAATEPVE